MLPHPRRGRPTRTNKPSQRRRPRRRRLRKDRPPRDMRPSTTHPSITRLPRPANWAISPRPHNQSPSRSPPRCPRDRLHETSSLPACPRASPPKREACAGAILRSPSHQCKQTPRAYPTSRSTLSRPPPAMATAALTPSAPQRTILQPSLLYRQGLLRTRSRTAPSRKS